MKVPVLIVRLFAPTSRLLVAPDSSLSGDGHRSNDDSIRVHCLAARDRRTCPLSATLRSTPLVH
ncbi:MAG: hypothetical protein H7Z11_23170 [Verrucomicrobia bacterium]|nr:hypothetical protein [Leptolyngbya sp. ES-bin-22]